MILTRTGQSDELLKTFTEKVKSRAYRASKDDVKKPVSISYLMNQLNRENYSLPFIDETGYSQELYMLLDTNAFSDISVFQKLISEYGLQLKEYEREVEMFVLSDIR